MAEVAALLVRALGGALSVSAPDGPLPAGDPLEVLAAASAALPQTIPEQGDGADAALHRMAALLTRWGLDLSHPHAAAHLQPAPLAVAVAADALASATNASLDTYDSGPATLAVERWAIRQLATLAGLGPCAGGVLTPGGSLSTLLGLLLARDAAGDQFGVDVRTDGVAALGTPVVLASELAHFSVLRACSALGLG
ncbi:MAG: pyridoxal-dependent decarboxylase, partial [Mycobacteriaceae bacterium]